MTSVIKISNHPFNEDLCPDLGDNLTWVLFYRYKIDASIKIIAFDTLESAKNWWTYLQTDNYRVPLLIQTRKFHLYHCPEEWFNYSGGLS